jgi:hypothetical protein
VSGDNPFYTLIGSANPCGTSPSTDETRLKRHLGGKMTSRVKITSGMHSENQNMCSPWPRIIAHGCTRISRTQVCLCSNPWIQNGALEMLWDFCCGPLRGCWASNCQPWISDRAACAAEMPHRISRLLTLYASGGFLQNRSTD